MLDLFCGRFGWSKAFAARGWECMGIDLVAPAEIPDGCAFIQADILEIRSIGRFDFICASSPCEQFSVHGMKHFHPNPKYPELGLQLFNHTRRLCEASEAPYVMENVRAAQQFVGKAVHHCGPFYLWGNAVPPLMPQGIVKGIQLGGAFKNWKTASAEERKAVRKTDFMIQYRSGSKERKDCTAKAATIPPELAACVVDYAESLLFGNSAAVNVFNPEPSEPTC